MVVLVGVHGHTVGSYGVAVSYARYPCRSHQLAEAGLFPAPTLSDLCRAPRVGGQLENSCQPTEGDLAKVSLTSRAVGGLNLT